MSKREQLDWAKRIKSAREYSKLTQDGAADAWGFLQQTLSLWEQGETVPRGLYREKLEKILKKIERKIGRKLAREASCAAK